MELLFGSHVRSGGRRIGYLAGIEVDPASNRVTKIIFSHDGKLTTETHSRAIAAVHADGSGIAVDVDAPVDVPSGERRLWSRGTRLCRGHAEMRLAAVTVGPAGEIESITGRHHWWSGRARIPAAAIDGSQPGQITVRGSDSAHAA
jgi:hypothetical protein